MKKIFKRIILPIIFAAIITVACSSGILLSVANSINDSIYQRPSAPDERIVIIGIDDRAIAEFGPWPWDREIMAKAIEFLNSDPQTMPAIIGLDAVFDGESDIQSDKFLADVAAENSNVVVGSLAVFGSTLITNDSGDFYIDEHVVLDFIEPYAKLKASTMQGHVNAMLDEDGILRHAIWEIELTDGSVIPAFYRVIAEKFSEIAGLNPIKTPPTDGRNNWYVVQQSLPNSYSDAISVLDLVNEDVPSQFFDDKIVLIGPYASGLQDEYKTPISPAENMYGVEYQANAIAALLSENVKYEPISLQFVIVFLFSFSSIWLMYNRKLLVCMIIWLSIMSVWFIVCLVAFEMGVVLYIFYVLFSVTAIFLSSIVINYLREYDEKKQLSLTFSRYVAPEIVSELLKNNSGNLELGGKDVEIAVLFADIRGFTNLSSQLPPTKVVEIINKILTVSGDGILKNQGTLDKYIGDCTMAFWGAPLPQDDYIFRAVKAALEISENLNKLTSELKEEYGYSLGCGIGVNCGPAVVGNIGSPTRMDYTVISNTVNAASRLEGIAEVGEVLVSRSVVDALKGRVNFEYLGNEFNLKGLQEDFEVYKAISIIDK